MQYTPEKIGRKILLKQVALSVVVILLLPLILVFITNIGSENLLGYSTFYKNTFSGVIKNPLTVIIPSITIIGLTYLIGGRIGKKVLIDKSKPYSSVFSGLMVLWTGFYLSCILSETIRKVVSYGLTADNIEHVFISWLIYGLIPFIAFALTCSSILSVVVSWEFKKAIKKNETHYNNK